MKSFKEQCIDLRKKDKTLNEIVKITSRSKTTVYFHIKDIPLSEKKKKEISENTRQRALEISGSRRGIALKSYKKFKSWTPDMVSLTAHLIFDGELRRSTCGYSNRSIALINRVKTLFQEIYDYPPRKHFDSRSGVHKIYYHNVELGNFMIFKAEELTQKIAKLSLTCQKEFIRAFFDDEGCMDVRLKYNKRTIRGYQNDVEILKIIQKKIYKHF